MFSFILSNAFQYQILQNLYHRHILATTAMACLLQENNEYELKLPLLKEKLVDAARNLLRERRGDGSFGSVYTTAIAAQALMSVHEISWDPKPTLDYLARYQSEDGSFGDMLATYYTLPALSGRSLLHLRNTLCDQPNTIKESESVSDLSPQDILNLSGPKKNVFYSLRIGYPESYSHRLQLTVPDFVNLFNIMRVAEYLDQRFRFSYKITNGEVEVSMLSNFANDPERGLYWNLYVTESGGRIMDFSRRYSGDIRKLIPADSEEVTFWYLRTEDVRNFSG